MSRDPVAQILAAYPVLHHALRQREVKSAGGRVSAHQVTALAHLASAEGATMTELAGLMGVALPTMSLLIDRLAGGGLVRRDRDPADGRRVLLRLTEAGGKAVRGRSLLDPDRVRLLLAALTPAERAAGVEGLLTLAKAAQRVATDSTPSRGRS